MRQDEVPQDEGMADGLKEVCYALDNDGRYTLAASAGWEPKNIANSQAWELIAAQIRQISAEVRAGSKSMLAFHMAKNQMDIALLAQYTGFWRWRIKRHLRPKVFARLPHSKLALYAELFKITVRELTDIRELDNINLPRPAKDTDED